MAGPVFGYLLGDSVGGDHFNTTDFGLTLGGGIACPVFHSMQIFLEARYYQGLSNLDRTGGLWRQEGIELTVGAIY